MNNYNLAIEIKNNDFYPIEINSLLGNNGCDFHILENIDTFTSKLTKDKLTNFIISSGYKDIINDNYKFVIIKNNKGKVRKIEDGIVFKDNSFIITDDYLIKEVYFHLSDALYINKLYNFLNKERNKSEALISFTSLIKTPKNVTKDVVKYIPFLSYTEKRKLGFYLLNN